MQKSFVGWLVGETVGDKVGNLVGDKVGNLVGNVVGEAVGDTVGDTVGAKVQQPEQVNLQAATKSGSVVQKCSQSGTWHAVTPTVSLKIGFRFMTEHSSF